MLISHVKIFIANLLRTKIIRRCDSSLKPSQRLLATATSRMKRKAVDSDKAPKAKRVREPLPEYCDATPQRGEDGSIIWPASAEAIQSARSFLREWYA